MAGLGQFGTGRPVVHVHTSASEGDQGSTAASLRAAEGGAHLVHLLLHRPAGALEVDHEDALLHLLASRNKFLGRTRGLVFGKSWPVLGSFTDWLMGVNCLRWKQTRRIHPHSRENLCANVPGHVKVLPRAARQSARAKRASASSSVQALHATSFVPRPSLVLHQPSSPTCKERVHAEIKQTRSSQCIQHSTRACRCRYPLHHPV